MRFIKEKTKDYFLLDTNVENMFINEYMASAPGDYVKVYLFALMYAGLGVEFDNEDIAKQLCMDIEDVLKAWTYWEKAGVIRKLRGPGSGSLEYDVEFVMLKDMLYGTHDEKVIPELEQSMNSQMSSPECREMFARIEKSLGRIISGSEMGEIISWISDYGTDTEVIAFAFRYCAEKDKRSVKYTGAVIRNWIMEGYRTIEEVKEYLGQTEGRSADCRRVFRALGFHRNPTEEERRIMDGWFDEMSFDMDTILEACSKTAGISSPNINYVNRILENWHATGGGRSKDGISTGDIMRYYEALRQKEEREAGQRREEVYRKVPRIKEIEDEENSLGAKLSKIVVSNQVDKKESIAKIKERIDTLSMERAFLLTDNGFELDFMDMKYQCPHCRDTGMLETGERCQCFGEITEQKIKQITE